MFKLKHILPFSSKKSDSIALIIIIFLLLILYHSTCNQNLLNQTRLYGWESQNGDSAGYSVAFSPDNTSEKLILHLISEAKESVLLAAYSFTNKLIAEALVGAHKKGVSVQILADEKNNTDSPYSMISFLSSRGIDVRLNGKYNIMHHKFIIIDKRHIQTGSFNYSGSAVNKNAENVLVLWNVPELAEKYMIEWKQLWKEGKPVLSVNRR